MCLKPGARIDSTVVRSPSVIAVSQRRSCASTSAHGPLSIASAAVDATSEQASASAVACGWAVNVAAISARTPAHFARADRVMAGEYVSRQHEGWQIDDRMTHRRE